MSFHSIYSTLTQVLANTFSSFQSPVMLHSINTALVILTEVPWKMTQLAHPFIHSTLLLTDFLETFSTSATMIPQSPCLTIHFRLLHYFLFPVSESIILFTNILLLNKIPPSRQFPKIWVPPLFFLSPLVKFIHFYSLDGYQPSLSVLKPI